MHARSQQKKRTYARTSSRGTQYQRGAVPRRTRVAMVAHVIWRTAEATNAATSARVGWTRQAKVTTSIGERSGSSTKPAGTIPRLSLAQRGGRSKARRNEQATFRFCTGASDTAIL